MSEWYVWAAFVLSVETVLLGKVESVWGRRCRGSCLLVRLTCNFRSRAVLVPLSFHCWCCTGEWQVSKSAVSGRALHHSWSPGGGRKFPCWSWPCVDGQQLLRSPACRFCWQNPLLMVSALCPPAQAGHGALLFICDLLEFIQQRRVFAFAFFFFVLKGSSGALGYGH